MTRFSPGLVAEMAEIIERRSGLRPTDDVAHESIENLVGFFETLMEIDRRLKAEGRPSLDDLDAEPIARYDPNHSGDGRPGNCPERSRRHVRSRSRVSGPSPTDR